MTKRPSDVTELERAFTGAEGKFDALLKAQSDGVLVADAETGKFVLSNQAICNMLGYSPNELMAMGIDQIHPHDALPLVMEAFERSKLRLNEQIRNIPVRRKDGSVFPADISTSSVILQGTIYMVGVFSDVTERNWTEHRLQNTTRALKTLTYANAVLVHASTQAGLFEQMCQVIVDQGNYRMAWVGLADNDSDKSVRPVAHKGYEAGYLPLAKISWADTKRGQGPVGTAIREGAPQVVREFATDAHTAPWRKEALKRGYGSAIALPLRDGSRVFGALTIYAAEPEAFGLQEVELMSELAANLSYGVEALRVRADREAALQKLEQALEKTVEVIASTLEMRDPYTAGHQRRVATIAEAIALEMRLSADQNHGLHLASIVHDLGKIAVPAEILTKPGKLTGAEYELVKAHPQSGYDILKQVDFPWPVADIVLQHHERLDGSGYPNGLKGDAILLEAKILGVADVVESMMSNRPYRLGLGLDVALGEIREGRGRLYDSAVVDACIKVMQSDGATLSGGQS